MTETTQPSLLTSIKDPSDLQELSINDLETLAQEVRDVIIQTVSCNGGHLAPSLGVVELTLALMNIFNPSRDKIIWDVGHQAYAYKILTRGEDRFRTLRQKGGISGFPRPEESRFDHFCVGHSSTSISAGLGMAVARDLLGNDNKVLAVIGDGSMTAGMAYEGLNQAGDLDRNLVVILNDNAMSIAKNVGALSSFFSRKLADQRYLRFKDDLKNWLRQVPKIGDELVNYARRSEESLKSFFTPGMLFEAFKFTYLGPINGHNIRQLTNVFEQVQTLNGPTLVHVLTTKGKGYPPAETNPTHFHGVGCFEPETGKSTKSKASFPGDYSTVFGTTLTKLAEEDQAVVAITAAMPEGTGLGSFKEKFPDRFFDVGICEQHAVTFAAGLASQGLRPCVAIYSTFLQRSFDQVIHDVCLQNLPVTFCLDRSGLVGEDGPTHHGAFDLSFLRQIPNMVLMAPKDEPELQQMMVTAMHHSGPAAIRYPRGVGPGHELLDSPSPLPLGAGERIKDGRDAAVLAVGSRVAPALEAVRRLEGRGPRTFAVYNARFIKPLPAEIIQEVAGRHSRLLILEENVLAGGFSSAVLEFLADKHLMSGLQVTRLGLPDRFVQHGSIKDQLQEVGLDIVSIEKALEQL